jgi:hypothetical protein
LDLIALNLGSAGCASPAVNASVNAMMSERVLIRLIGEFIG